MPHYRSVDQTMPKPFARKIILSGCFLILCFLNQSSASEISQINLQKTLLQDLIRHSNLSRSVSKSTQQSEKFDLRFKGSRSRSQSHGGLRIKFRPAIQNIKVTCYGAGQNGTEIKKCQTTNEEGSVLFNDFMPESEICFVAEGVGSSNLLWWHQCEDFPVLNKTSNVIISLDNLKIRPHEITLIGSDRDGTTYTPFVPIGDVTENFHLTSQGGQLEEHSDFVKLVSDSAGTIRIFANVDLTGSVNIDRSTEFETFSSKMSFGNDEHSSRQHEITMTAICPERLSQPTTFNDLSTWSQSFGLGPLPVTSEEALQQGWKSVNKLCDENQSHPGYRYENSEAESSKFLILVFDTSGILSGVQVAIPKALVDPSATYIDNEYYMDGFYDGEPAYLISTYFTDPKKVCNSKTALELVCGDGLGGVDDDRAFVVSKNSLITLYLNENEAKIKGWVPLAPNNDNEVLLAPSSDNASNRKFPFSAIYRKSRLVGLNLLHEVRTEMADSFKSSVLETRTSDDRDGILTTSFYMVEDKKVRVFVKLRLGEDAHRYPRNYFFWSDSGDYGESREKNGKISPFKVKKSAKHVYIFGYSEPTATVHYAIIKVDPCRGHRDIHATVHRGQQSELEAVETQTSSRLIGSMAALTIGVAGRKAMDISMNLDSDGKLLLDTPKGVLVAWSVHGQGRKTHHHTSGERSYSITPFHKKSQLLKTIDLDIFICLEGKGGRHRHGGHMDAVVEVILEYEWGSQDDSREIVSVDYRGHVHLKQVPSPLPGEHLNVTIVSRIGRPAYLGSEQDFHRELAAHSRTVGYNDDSPVKINLCHGREHVVAIVRNGVNQYHLPGAKVWVKTSSNNRHHYTTDVDGASFFSFDNVDKFDIEVSEQGYDPVTISRSRRQDGETDFVYIDLHPHQKISFEVLLEDDGNKKRPAVGAVIEYKFDNGEVGIGGVDLEGFFELKIPGRVHKIVELAALLPLQSSCGIEIESQVKGWKKIYGVARLRDQIFPHNTRQSDHVIKYRVILPKIRTVEFVIDLQETFPDVAMYSSDVMALKDRIQHVEEKISHNTVKFGIEPGARTAHLFTAEWYNNRIIMTPLDPCLIIDETSVSRSGEDLVIYQDIYSNTVKVTVRTVTTDFEPCNNVTLEYMLAETEFELQSVDVSEMGEVIFHLPRGMLVTLEPKTSFTPAPKNPNFFVARDGLEVYLVFDTKSSAAVVVELIGEDFLVPEDTMVRYVAVDFDGDVISSEALFTDESSRIYFNTRRTVQYFEFSIAGSDGFDPVFYQPFDYVYNVTDSYWTPPLMIEIPVKTLKNVIVAVRDCRTGELIEHGAVATVPQDAPRWNSWYNKNLMLSQHEGSTDEQGLVFFNLEPDQIVNVQVRANGYHTFEENINIKSNVTYFVEANLCRDAKVHLKLIDAIDDNSVIAHVTIGITVDEFGSSKGKFEVRTNEDGRAEFSVRTDVKKIFLEILDILPGVGDPIIELRDEDDFLKESDIEIRVIETKVHLSVKSGVGHPDEVKATSDLDYSSSLELKRELNPYTTQWHLEVPARARHVYLVQADRSESRMGLVNIPIIPYHGRMNVDGFEGSVEVSVQILNKKQKPLKNAKLIWYLGHGLGSTWVYPDFSGRVKILAPPGELIILKPVESECGGDQQLNFFDARQDLKITLHC